MNPRGARIVALDKPTDKERGQWYFQRYITHLPTVGELVFFDRSWYNRAVVEPVMGFCTDEENEQFLNQVPKFEKMLIESGVSLYKYWFSVSRPEQFRRFKSRETDRLKQWKLSPVDEQSLSRWDDYTNAIDRMFEYTDTNASPWTVVRSDDKKRARLNCMRDVLHSLPYPNKNENIVHAPDPGILGPAKTMYKSYMENHPELEERAEASRIRQTKLNYLSTPILLLTLLSWASADAEPVEGKPGVFESLSELTRELNEAGGDNRKDRRVYPREIDPERIANGEKM